MKRLMAWSFALLFFCAAAADAQREPALTQPDPPITGYAYVVATEDSKGCLQCQRYGTGRCPILCDPTGNEVGGFPFAACDVGSLMTPLSYQYCDVWMGDELKAVSGYCYTWLCIGGGNFKNNVALGFFAGQSLAAGDFRDQAIGNTAIGWEALQALRGTRWYAGFLNTAVGDQALKQSVTGGGDVAVGAEALQMLNNPDPDRLTGRNTAIGTFALQLLEQGVNNVAVGGGAGSNLRNGTNNIYLGGFAGGVTSESNTIRLGSSQTSTFIAGIRNATLADDPQVVYIDGNGQLGLFTPGVRMAGPAAEGNRPRTPGDDAIAQLQRRIQAQEERIADLARALQEQGVLLDAFSQHLALQSQRQEPGPNPTVTPRTGRRPRFRLFRRP